MVEEMSSTVKDDSSSDDTMEIKRDGPETFPTDKYGYRGAAATFSPRYDSSAYPGIASFDAQPAIREISSRLDCLTDSLAALNEKVSRLSHDLTVML